MFIGVNGPKAHGPISIIHHYLEVHSSNVEFCHLHADTCNCIGQNKTCLLLLTFSGES